MKRIILLDITTSRRCTITTASSWWHTAKRVAHLGDGIYIFTVLALLYITGWLWNAPVFCRNVIIITLTVILSMLTTYFLKLVVKRQRPSPPGEFVTFQKDKYSFPSGHSSRMAALAIITTFFYPLLGWLLSILALIVAFARVIVGVHYLGDVLVGLSLGVSIAWGIIVLLPLLPIPIF